MYGGDCQVMHHSTPTSSMMMGGAGGGVVGGGAEVGVSMAMNMNINMGMGMTSDPMFPNPSPGMGMGMVNPSHFTGFMSNMPPFHHAFPTVNPKEEAMATRKEEEMESGGSGSGQLDGLSCGEEHDNADQAAQFQQQQYQQQQQEEQNQTKKKRYHRHTARQIQEMEAWKGASDLHPSIFEAGDIFKEMARLFKECPHPDDKQRLRLSQELGLKPRQVKFWFQNRRTQMKAQQDRADNLMLRTENESLRNENYRLQAAIRNVVCPSCGGPAMLGELSFDEHQICIENARLKEELDRLSCIAARYAGRPPHPQPPPMLMAPPPPPPPSLDLDMGLYGRHFPDMGIVPPPPAIPGNTEHPPQAEAFGVGGGNGGIVMEEDKGVVVELAVAATEQLVRMCRADGLLFVAGPAGEAMDVEEYGKVFQQQQQQQKRGEIRVEGTRDKGHVIMNGITLVDAFLDANKWVELFPTIVSNAKTLQIIAPGVGGSCNGTIQLMFAEFRVPTPLVPARDGYFFRYCQQNAEEGFWTIVDFPADGVHAGLQTPAGYKRRPSGCLLQDMPNGYSMVTWVELAEVDDTSVHKIFDEYVKRGLAFGANRWLSALQQQCDRLASLMARNVADLGGVIPNSEARKNIMRLTQRMMRTFFHNITQCSMAQTWTSLSDSADDPVRISTRKNTEPGQPNGVVLAAVSTTWLPFSHLQVFELLTDEKRRSQLDALSCGNSLHEIAHIANGSHQKNCVSLFRISASSNSSQNVELMLQESTTHPTGGSMVVYSNMDVDAIQVAMGGDDPSYIPLLPTGFIMLPAAQPGITNCTRTNGGEGGPDEDAPPPALGCLLTIGLQVLASAVPSTKLNLSSITAVNNHLSNTIHQITAALGGSNATTTEPSTAAATTPAPEP